MSISRESMELRLVDQIGIQLAFPAGSKTEKQGDLIFIYDPTGTKRWELQNFIWGWEETRRMRLGLQALAGGMTWHTLMGMYQSRSSETDEEKETGVEVTVISGDTSEDDTTPNQHVLYRTVRNGNLYIAYGGGYYGSKERVEADLQIAKALALTANELPKQIDVHATAQQLVKSFKEGKFEPPAFVLPEPKKLTFRLPLFDHPLSLPGNIFRS